MKPAWKKLYDSMKQELKSCWERHADEKTAIEQCFQISAQYWSIIESDVKENYFSSVDEEIDFYKHVKPLFVSEIRYHNMLYHAALFKPPSELVETKEFWAREKQRLEKFIRENKDFYDYYKSGSTECDEKWFRKKEEKDEDIKAQQYDLLASTLIALERYAEHIKTEIER
jgi:RteC protein